MRSTLVRTATGLSLVLAVLAGAGCSRQASDGGGGPVANNTPEPVVVESGTPTPTATPPPVTPTAPSIAAATATFAGTRHGNVEAALTAWEDFAASIEAELGSGDPLDLLRQVRLAEAKLFSTKEGAATVFANDRLLHGHSLTLTTGAAAEADPAAARGTIAVNGQQIVLAAAAKPAKPVKIIFVNGVMNTSEGAATTAAVLKKLLNVDEVELVYNHSIREPQEYALQTCVEAVADEWKRKRPKMKPTAPGTLNKLLAAFESTMQDGIDATLTVACKGLDAKDRALDSVYDLANSLSENVRQRFRGSQSDSSQVNDRLVPKINKALRDGQRVIVISHSQGTMFTHRALKDVNTWWRDVYTKSNPDCPESDEPSLSGTNRAPVGALYIAPALSAESPSGGDLDSGLQRYVMLEGDILRTGKDHTGWSIGNVPGNVEANDDQSSPWLPANFALIDRLIQHSSETYFQEGSESLKAIKDKFADLRETLESMSTEPQPDCPTSTPTASPNSSPPAIEDGDELTWVLWRSKEPFTGIGMNVTTTADFKKEMVASSWSGGGMHPEATFSKLLMLPNSFASKDEAVAATCANLTDVRMWPAGTGMHGVWTDGKPYPIGNFGC